MQQALYAHVESLRRLLSGVPSSGPKEISLVVQGEVPIAADASFKDEFEEEHEFGHDDSFPPNEDSHR